MRLWVVVVVLLSAGMLAADPARWAAEWPATDFSRTEISDWSQIMSGGPPKDGIPSIDNPVMVSLSPDIAIPEREPVISVELSGEVPRAYPVRYLMWHEIVNDVIGDVPVAVTFCPLCNSGMSFDRRVGEQVLEFGVSGKLRFSDMVMYDRETQSWWQQAVGRGIVGQMAGVELASLPTWMESYDQFAARNPDGLIMAEPRGYRRDYGRNPYLGYDSLDRPFLYNGEVPPYSIPPLARVVRVRDRAWPLDRLVQLGEIRAYGYVLSWAPGQASALDSARISEGRDIGNVRVRDANGADVPHDVMFAFAFHAFWPEGHWEVK